MIDETVDPKDLPPPKAIVHGGTRFVVERVTDPRADDDEKLFGDIRWMARRIRIDEALAVDRQAQVLVHELVHLLIWKAGGKVKLRLEERLCELVALGLMDLLVQNPALGEYLVRAAAVARAENE